MHDSSALFIKALHAHYDDVLRYARGLCAKELPDEAEDVLQDALLSALRAFDQLEDPSRFRPWLFRIVTRSYFRRRRRRFWRRFVPLDEGLPQVYSRDPSSDHDLLRALARLPESDRVALLLHDVAGLPVAAVAEIQRDRSLSATKSRLSRARRKVRSEWGQSFVRTPPPSLEEQALALLDTLPSTP